jgi:glycosyltransferase involved in cell wall biosynthesis
MTGSAIMTTPTKDRAVDATDSNGTVEVAPNGKAASHEHSNGKTKHAAERAGANGERVSPAKRRSLAIFCYENPDSPVGDYLSHLATALAARQVPLHIFCRNEFTVNSAGVTVHAVGDCPDGDLVTQVREFNSRASNAFQRQFPSGNADVTVLALEWSAASALTLLQATRGVDTILSLNSLERQRSDLGNELSRQIEEIEVAGLRQAKAVLVQEPKVADIAAKVLSDCAPRLLHACKPFPLESFRTQVDAGAVKERFKIGPTDPTILFIGDLDERHGPDVLMKAVPAVLKNHPQARFVFVGDGTLLWPIRVIARYLLLEEVVRLVGHLEGQPLFDLIQAADMVAVPSREATEWWQVQAAWAAQRPVVATHILANSLKLKHEHNAILVYPHESSCVWGVERLLFDWDLGRTIAKQGHQQLQEQFGWNGAAEQIEDLMGIPAIR